MKQPLIKAGISMSGAARLTSRFRRPEIRGLRGVSYILFAVLVCGLCGLGDFGDYLKTRLDLPMLFRARNLAGHGPDLSNKLRVILFDEAALAWLGAAEPSLAQWGEVIDRISARKPAMIIIQKVFGMLPPGSSDGDAKGFVNNLHRIRDRDNVQVVAGAYFSSSDNKFRAKITPSSEPSISPSAWGLDAGFPVPAQLMNLGFPVKDRSNDYFYGPNSKVLRAFSGIGSVDYQSNAMVPMAILGGGNTLVPHIVLAGFPNRSPGDGFVLVNGSRVPVNAKGEMLPNFVARDKIVRGAMSLKHLLDPASRDRAAEKTIMPGDLVLIGFTSSVDAADTVISTPLGQMPASLAIASVANSVVTGRFASEAPGDPLWWVLGAMVGFISAVWLPVSVGLLALAISGLVWAAMSFGVFLVLGVAIPWLVPVIGLITAGALVISRKASLGRTNAIKVAAAFDGRVSNQAMKAMARHPERMELECREVSISVMFIDIAGFSLFAERRNAQDVFDYLRVFLAETSKLILESNGVIDKSLGDGLLAYFGQDLDSPGEQMDHATRAFDCALRIQRGHLSRNQKALEDGLPVLPVRIGINSSTCLLGDLGTEKRMDITIVGGGVNFAKRLEDACDPGTILVSSTTYSLAIPRKKPSSFVRKFVRMKHMNALVEAFEFDPLATDPQLKVKLVEAFRKTIAVERVDRRWVVPEGKSITMISELGVCELVNFSGRGFSARLPALFARGSRLSFEVEAGALKTELKGCGIGKIDAEVRWSHGSGSNIVHGFSINGFSEEQAAAFNKVLLEYAFSDDEFKLPRIG